MTPIVVYLHDAMGKTLFRTWIIMYKALIHRKYRSLAKSELEIQLRMSCSV